MTRMAVWREADLTTCNKAAAAGVMWGIWSSGKAKRRSEQGRGAYDVRGQGRHRFRSRERSVISFVRHCLLLLFPLPFSRSVGERGGGGT